MRRLLRPSLGKATAACTLLGLGIILLAGERRMFSPGPLKASNSANASRASHASFENRCSACHASPGHPLKMNDRCLACHQGIQAEISDRKALHGKMPRAKDCLQCHTDHHGPDASITSFAKFSHDWTAFPLTGKHQGLECAKCHVEGSFHGVSTQCVSCHREPAVPQVHRVYYGSNCASCHSTQSWSGGSLRHSFPLNHANALKKLGCKVCHPSMASDAKNPETLSLRNADLTTTCYGCHHHQKDKELKRHRQRTIDLAAFDACWKCHPFARRNR